MCLILVAVIQAAPILQVQLQIHQAAVRRHHHQAAARHPVLLIQAAAVTQAEDINK